jgi:transcription antitermination factor NusG
MKPYLSADKFWYVIRTNIKGEDKAMRNLSMAGYEVYYPRKRIEIKHKRTNVYSVKEQPLMMRYLFVAQPERNADWYTLRACEGVEGVLGIDGPMRVPFRVVSQIYDAEFDMQFDDTRAARIHRKEEAKTKKETTAMKFQPGLLVHAGQGPFDHYGHVQGVTNKGTVQVLFTMFGSMMTVEFQPEYLAVA